jgi:hypothetical protein
LTLDVVDAGGWMSEVQTAGAPGSDQTNREWLIVPASKLENEKLFLHDRHVYCKVPIDQLKAQLQIAIGNQFTIESLDVGDVPGRPGVGGLKCQVRSKEIEGLFVLQPRSWGTPDVSVKIDLIHTRAFDVLTEIGKALTNFDEGLRQTIVPKLEIQIAQEMQKFKLPNGVKIEVIGLRTDGLVLVSNRLDDAAVVTFQLLNGLGK